MPKDEQTYIDKVEDLLNQLKEEIDEIDDLASDKDISDAAKEIQETEIDISVK